MFTKPKNKDGAKCFICNRLSHKNMDFLKVKQEKVYTLKGPLFGPSAKEKGKGTLGCMILIFSILVSVLFDTGAAHSFVSRDLVDRLELETTYVIASLYMVIPISGYPTLELR